MNPPELDRIDRKILDALQRHGRLPMTELAQEVGLSTSPVTERVRRLERAGVITGYHARVDPAALGRKLVQSAANKRWLHHPKAEQFLAERVALLQRVYRR